MATPPKALVLTRKQGSNAGHVWYQDGWVMVLPSQPVRVLGSAFECCEEVSSFCRGRIGVSSVECEVSRLFFSVGRLELSAAAWIDFSGDPRRGSCTVLVIEGVYSARQVVELAGPLFPGLLERQNAPLVYLEEVKP